MGRLGKIRAVLRPGVQRHRRRDMVDYGQLDGYGTIGLAGRCRCCLCCSSDPMAMLLAEGRSYHRSQRGKCLPTSEMACETPDCMGALVWPHRGLPSRYGLVEPQVRSHRFSSHRAGPTRQGLTHPRQYRYCALGRQPIPVRPARTSSSGADQVAGVLCERTRTVASKADRGRRGTGGLGGDSLYVLDQVLVASGSHSARCDFH